MTRMPYISRLVARVSGRRFAWNVAGLLLSTLPASCFTPMLFDFTDVEVAVVRSRKNADDGSVDGLIIDVKNVAGRADGFYVIELPGSLLLPYTEAQETPGSRPGPGGPLVVSWEDKADGLRMINGVERILADSLQDLRAGPEGAACFNLRADVEEGPDRLISVDVWIDGRRSGSWVKLGSAAIGKGTQSTRARQVAWILAPATVAADIAIGAVGIAGTIAAVLFYLPFTLIFDDSEPPEDSTEDPAPEVVGTSQSREP